MFGLLQLTVRCSDIPVDELADAARAVETDFRKYRPWHQNVRCQIDGTFLILRAQNDFDEDGEALCDDVRTSLKECVSTFGSIQVVAIEPLPDPPLAGALAVRSDGAFYQANIQHARRMDPARQPVKAGPRRQARSIETAASRRASLRNHSLRPARFEVGHRAGGSASAALERPSRSTNV
jgi:hypothetical protein